MDKEDIIKLILLEDKNKRYKLQKLIHMKKSELIFILLSLNIDYYRKSYKFSIDKWYELIMNNEFYFDKCPREIKDKFIQSYHYRIIDKYPNTRFFYYDSIGYRYYDNRYLEHILSKYPEYKNEIEEKLNIDADILKDFKLDLWVNLIDNNPTYYYHICPKIYLDLINKNINWKKIIIYDIKFLEIYNSIDVNDKVNIILDIDDWYYILIKHMTKIKKIPKTVLSKLEKYHWLDIIKNNPNIIKTKKYKKYFKEYLDSRDFWYELITYSDIFIKYCPKNIFESLLNNYHFCYKLIQIDQKYLKLISIEKIFDEKPYRVNEFLIINFKFLYKLPKTYLKKNLESNNVEFKEIIILNFMDIENLGFYIKFKYENEFIDELKQIDKKFRRSYEKFLKYLE